MVALNLWYANDPGTLTLPGDAGGENWDDWGDWLEWDDAALEDIINPEDRAGDDSRFAELLISPDGQYARLRVEMAAPGDTVTATLQAENIGSVNALLDNVVYTGDIFDLDALTVTVTHDWDELPLDTNATTTNGVTVTITWDGEATADDFFDSEEGGPIFEFVLTADYVFNAAN